jgi:hypothetical protein
LISWRPPDDLPLRRLSSPLIISGGANGERSQAFNRIESVTIHEEESMPRNNNRGGSNRGRNNNPEGRNQYSGWTETAKDRPFATAAAAAAAVGAGVFLWSRRNQITDQLSNLSDQISEWREGTPSDSSSFGQDSGTSAENFMASSGSGARRGSRKTQSQISEEALTLKETGKTV